MIEKIVLNDREYWQATVGDKSRLFDMDKLHDANAWAVAQCELADVAKAVPSAGQSSGKTYIPESVDVPNSVLRPMPKPKKK